MYNRLLATAKCYGKYQMYVVAAFLLATSANLRTGRYHIPIAISNIAGQSTPTPSAPGTVSCLKSFYNELPLQLFSG